MIDLNHRDRRYYEGSLHSLLWTIGLETEFKKNLQPDTVIEKTTGYTYKRTNYIKTLDKIINIKNYWTKGE